MKTRKRTCKRIAFFDSSETVRYLEKKAREGWVLENVFGIWWTFRRVEPRTAHVWVTYLNQDAYEPQPSQQVEDLAELGGHTGWKLTVETPTMQVFYNWSAHPLPMETDPVAHVEGMHRALKQGALRNYRVCFGLAMVTLLVSVWNLMEMPLWTLSSRAEWILDDFLLFVAIGAELVPYELWYRRAKKLAAQGEWLDTRPWGKVVRWVLVAYVVLWLTGIVVTLVLKPWANARLFVIVTGLLFGIGWCLVLWMRDVLRRRKASWSANELVTSAVYFFLVMAYVSAMAFGFTRLNWFSPTAEDSWWSQFPDGLPLTVERLRGDVGDQDFLVSRNGEESLALGYYQGWQISEAETGPEEDMDTVMYTVTLVKLPILYDLCRDEMLWADHEQVDPSSWLAQEAYRKTNGVHLKTYLLCYQDCVVEITFGWEPTQEQMQLVGETFGGLQ